MSCNAQRICPGLATVSALALALGLAGPALAQSAPTEGLLAVYGAQAISMDGDVDRREQIFFSVPADTAGRIFVRLFDPEIFGKDDFTRGGPRDSITTFRVFGGEGAFSAADRPEMQEDGTRGPETGPGNAADGPGRTLLEQAFDDARDTDGRWITLGSVRARQGEVIDGRAYFRIDVEGTAGNDGNGYSVGVSTVRDRDRAPDDLEMFAYQPTIRWTEGRTATRVNFDGSGGGPYTVQNFDSAIGTVTVVTDYQDIDIRTSGQDRWTIDSTEAQGTDLALSLFGGQETPNDVTVSVFGPDGRPLALQMPPVMALDPARPTAVGTARPLADCRAVAFDANASTGRKPLGYIWDFGDGSKAEDSVVAHRYAEPGRYEAELFVLESGDRPGRGASVKVPVHVRSAPIAKPGDPIVIAPGQKVPFDGSASEASDSPITRYVWTFGDGTGAEGVTAEKTYDASGLYRAVLRVEDDSEHPCDFGVSTRNVTVNFPPVAEAGTAQTAETGQVLNFNGSASYDVDGTVEGYSWDMGDGTILEGATVTHAYTASGVFTATLTVTDDSGVANNIATDQLVVAVNAPPQPVIEIPPRPVSVSEVAELNAAASTDADGTILSYMWDFGDGAIAEGQIVNYAWTAPGIYPVKLTVTDDSGTASAVQETVMEIVIDAAPVSDAGPDQMVTASEVQFDGTASSDAEGGISSYEWDFGDGNTGVGPTPLHAYARPGVYEVALVVRDESGAPLNRGRDTTIITVNATPIADAGPPLTVAPGEEFVLSGRASLDPDGSIASHVWQLPDGSTRAAERISQSLSTPGLHRYGLTVEDNFAGGAASDNAEVLITVNAQPVAEAGVDLLVAPGDPVVLDAGQSYDTDGEIVAYQWDFNDGADSQATARIERTYETAGVWSAQLVVTDDSAVANSTASDDITIRVNHAPVAEAGPDVDTEVLQVTLDAGASSDADGDLLIYTWDFGDGSAPVNGRVVTHDYPGSGIYPVTLRVDDATGLSNATAVDTSVVTIKARPLADAGGTRQVCSGQPILFDASGSMDPDGGLLAYSWDFGDGTTSDLINPQKTYERPGAYSVTLDVRNGTGTDWGSDVDRIAALVREGPIADAGPDLTVCTNQPVRFDGSGSTDADGAVNAFAWTFGDGGIASGEKPEYQFAKPGNYVVNLTITGEALGSCSPLDTDTANVKVVAAPAQTIVGSEIAAAGLEALFEVQLGDLEGASILSQNWTFSDGTTAQGSSVTHVFAKPGDYTVTVVTDLAGGNAGCSTIETSRRVIVNAAPMAQFEGPTKAAAGEAIVFDASASNDPDGAITSFAWDFGDGSVGQGLRATHRYAEAGDYQVSLTVTDNAGVGNSVISQVRSVSVNPEPVAGLSAPAWVCPAVSVPWQVSASGNTKVEWLFGDGNSATGAQTSHSFAEPGLYPVSVTLDDGSGLANGQRREEAYARVNRTPTALAGPDRTVCAGDVMVFDASASADLDGEITEYLWSFSDGVTLSGPTVERSFEASGPVDVTLTVRDDSGLQCGIATDTAGILVNHAPVVDAGPDITMKLGAAHDVARFDASSAMDEDGQGLNLSWDFGDGATGTGAITRHRYTKPGTYTVTVEARDPTGLACGIGQDTAIVTALPRE